MQLQDFYPIVVTERLTDCRDFYRRWFELEVVFEASWFVLLGAGARGGRPNGARAVRPGRRPGHPSLRDEPFGQRRFGLLDPAGVWIDVVEQIEPTPGW